MVGFPSFLGVVKLRARSQVGAKVHEKGVYVARVYGAPNRVVWEGPSSPLDPSSGVSSGLGKERSRPVAICISLDLELVLGLDRKTVTEL